MRIINFLILFCFMTCQAYIRQPVEEPVVVEQPLTPQDRVQQIEQALHSPDLTPFNRNLFRFELANLLRRYYAPGRNYEATNLYHNIIKSWLADPTSVNMPILLDTYLDLADLMQQLDPETAESYYRFVLSQENVELSPAIFQAARVGLAEVASTRVFENNSGMQALLDLLNPVLTQPALATTDTYSRAQLLAARIYTHKGESLRALERYHNILQNYHHPESHVSKKIAYEALFRATVLMHDILRTSPRMNRDLALHLLTQFEDLYREGMANQEIPTETLIATAVSIAWIKYLFIAPREYDTIEYYLTRAIQLYDTHRSIHTPDLTIIYRKAQQLLQQIRSERTQRTSQSPAPKRRRL